MKVKKSLIAMLIVGFASGLPIGLGVGLLQAWFTEEGIALKTIGAVTLIGLPYSLKFLWAPLFDVVRLRFFDQYRSWMVILQASIVLILLYLSGLSPREHGLLIFTLGCLISWCSASQDIVIDAYRVRLLSPEERGLASAYTIFAWRMAALLSGGGTLLVAEYWGWSATFWVMAGLMFMMMGLTILCVPKLNDVPVERTISQPFYSMLIQSIQDLVTRPQFFLLLGFVLFYKMGNALLFSLMTNFLLKEQGFLLSEIAVAFKTAGVMAGILGAFFGGWLMMKMSLFRALLVFGVLQALSNGLFVGLALAPKDFMFMSACIFVESFCSGMSTAAFLAFLMSLCHPRFPATQFALLSAFDSIPRIVSGPIAAMLIPEIGWPVFYFICFLLSFPALFMLMRLSFADVVHEKTIPA